MLKLFIQIDNYGYRFYLLWIFKHCLIVFGGIQGIEGMLEDDEHNVHSRTNVRDLFDLYLNTCMGQGLRTIRTEEAIMISLAVLRPELDKLKE